MHSRSVLRSRGLADRLDGNRGLVLGATGIHETKDEKCHQHEHV